MIDDTGSVEGMHAFIYCTKWRSGQVSPMPYGQTLKDRATQLLVNYKSGALVTQKSHPMFYLTDNLFHSFSERASFSFRSASNFSPCFSATRNLNEKSIQIDVFAFTFLRERKS